MEEPLSVITTMAKLIITKYKKLKKKEMKELTNLNIGCKIK